MTKYNHSCTLLKYMFNHYQVSIVGKRRFSSIYKKKDNIAISKIGIANWSIIPIKGRIDVTYRLSKIGTINK